MHKITSCLVNEQNCIFNLLCHSLPSYRLSCCILFNSSFQKKYTNFFMGLSPLYVHCENYFHNIYKHHLPMKKGTRIIFISPLRNQGVKRIKLEVPLTVVIQFKLQQKRKEKWYPVDYKLSCKLQWFSNCFKTTSAITKARHSNGSWLQVNHT